MEQLTLKISSHSTPYTDVPPIEKDGVRLCKTSYSRGFYRMEGVMGYEFFEIVKPIVISCLQVRRNRWQSLMVDDPMHWLGMQELASLADPGSILVAGLGMGLILHHLVKREDIDKITVVEQDLRVINLISPYLPTDDRIVVLNRGFFSFCLTDTDSFDTAIVDLWTLGEGSSKKEREHVRESMMVANVLAHRLSSKVLIWGIRGYQLRRKS